MFLWYDRENDNFVELETSHDSANSTVSVETTHFSEYILVDAEEWFENWKKIEKETNWTERRNTTIMYYITKCDDKNDPKYLDSDRDNSIFKHYSNNREMVFKHLLSLMSDDDRIGFSSTDDNGKWVSTIFMPKDHFDISKGVNINLSKCGLKNDEAFEIVYAADDLMTFCKNYNNRIVYFTDRDIKVSRSSYSAEFYKNYKKVPVIFVCTGNFDKTNIQKIADETGGAVFNLTSIDELGLALNNYDENPLEKLFTDMDYLLIDPGFKDSDGDGFSDIEEEYGIVTSGGRKIQTNPETKHSDNDGLADNEEIDVDKSAEKVIIKGKKVRKAYHHMKSDPTKADSDGDNWSDPYEINVSKTDPLEIDTDKDGMDDYLDDFPLEYNKEGTVYNRKKAVEYAQKWYIEEDGYDPNYFHWRYNCTGFASQCIQAGGMKPTVKWKCVKDTKTNSFNESVIKYHYSLLGYYYDKSGWMWSDSWCVSDKLFKWLSSTNCRYKNIAYRINKSSFSNQVFFCITNGLIKPGDLLFFSHSENGEYTHTVFVENIDKEKNTITILQQGNDNKYGHRKEVNIELLNENGYDHCMLVHFYFNLK